MAEPRKRQALQDRRTIHPARETVTAELFLKHPEFFDPEDKLQVRYELMRATGRGEMTVTEACRVFGISRQTFYILQRAFSARGVAGQQAPGRRSGPSGVQGRPRLRLRDPGTFPLARRVGPSGRRVELSAGLARVETFRTGGDQL